MSGYQAEPNYYTSAPAPNAVAPANGKDENVTLILAVVGLLCGISGIHRLYLGKIGTGLLQLFLSPWGYLLLGWVYLYALGIPVFFISWIWNIVDIIRYREMTHQANYGSY